MQNIWQTVNTKLKYTTFLWVDFSFNIPERRAGFTLSLPSNGNYETYLHTLWNLIYHWTKYDNLRSDRLFRLWNQQTPLSPSTPYLNVCLFFSYLCTSITKTSKIRERNIKLRYARNTDLILTTLHFISVIIPLSAPCNDLILIH